MGPALSSASETPTEMVLEDLYKSKLQDSVQLQTIGPVRPRDNSKQWPTEIFKD